MILIPRKRETLILPISAIKVVNRLSLVTQPALLTMPKDENENIRFIGHINPVSFKISRKINYPQNYLPIITGVIEEFTRGCIIFLKYNFFFSSLIFFVFWTLMSFVIGLFFLLYSREYLFGAISFTSGLINYTVTVLNFNKQVKISRKALDEALMIPA